MRGIRALPLILVADDDRLVRLAARECLESSGFSVIEAEDGARALSRFEEHRPDIVVLDVVMPILDGFEVCRSLRALPAGRDTPVLILTVLGDTASIDRAFAAGATDFADKPMNWGVLPRRIRYLLRAAQTARELREARRAADAASRAKGEFLRNVTHELRTPMTSIFGHLDALEEDVALRAAGPSAAERLRRIRESSRSLLDLIDSVVEVVRVDASAQPPQELDPAEVAREVLASQRRNADEKGLELAVTTALDLPARVLADEHALRAILTHLVANGIAFTERGHVRVQLVWHRSARHATLELCVDDTGIGIPPDERERVFEPFAQRPGADGALPSGAGLGLTVVKRIVESLSGSIAIEGEPGVGSCFRVRIPVGLPREEADEGGTPAPSGLRLDACRVLYAEDGVDNRRLVQRILERAGAQLVLVECGEEAIDRVLAADPPFDLVLMDMQLPGIDGCAATRVLRDAGVAIPIVALTAHSAGGEQERCLDAGCTDYLTKPIRPVELTAAISRHVSESRKPAAG